MKSDAPHAGDSGHTAHEIDGAFSSARFRSSPIPRYVVSPIWSGPWKRLACCGVAFIAALGLPSISLACLCAVFSSKDGPRPALSKSALRERTRNVCQPVTRGRWRGERMPPVCSAEWYLT